MPKSDGWGQDIQLWQMTDAPSIPDAVAAIADGVIPRGVLRFASASERGATLVGDYTPVDGMLTWLEDVGRLELRVDGVWVVVAVGNRAWTTVPLASGWTQNGNSQGTFQYRVVNLFGEDSLMFRGGIGRIWTGTVLSAYTLTASPLPPAATPSTLRTLTVPCSDTNSDRIALKLDVQPDGHLKLFGFATRITPPWVGFNGVFTSL
ncbi:hypothetical protein [Streptomyces sp. enrichment culture]|uniref:hypothetical protein n=1 Tax=Streptomyces sp. enrichment culture TaxID=1795815 RepID=UPI003F5491F9